MPKPTRRELLIVLGIVAVGALLAIASPSTDRTPRLNVGEERALQDLGLAPLDPDPCFADRHAALLREMAERSGATIEMACESGRCCVTAYERVVPD